MVSKPSRRSAARLAIVLLAAFVAVLTATSSFAAPGDPTTPPNEGDENITLGEALEKANADFLQAQAALDASKKRQVDINTKYDALQKELGPLQEHANAIAAANYRAGGLRTAGALLDSDSPDTFMNKAMMVQTIAIVNDRELHRLNELKKQLTELKKAADAEVAQQQAQTDIMAKKKTDTEKALALAGGEATGGFVNVNSPVAAPSPRAADGSWPKESCTVNDPTTDGCVTQRNLHAMQEALKAGFTRFVSCHRNGGPYEHPKGRACDYSMLQKGFGGDAQGADKVYGSNLAAYFVRNADNLAVLYVIWYRQIWTPAAGWHRYSGQHGDPSSDHTNHVHLSVI
jgi:hypothetical protein